MNRSSRSRSPNPRRFTENDDDKPEQKKPAAAEKEDDGGEANPSLICFGLRRSTPETMVKDAFEAFGPVVEVRLIRERKNEGRQFATITFRNAEDAKIACRELHQKDIDGYRVRIEPLRKREQRRDEGWRRRGNNNDERNNQRNNDRRRHSPPRHKDREPNPPPHPPATTNSTTPTEILCFTGLPKALSDPDYQDFLMHLCFENYGVMPSSSKNVASGTAVTGYVWFDSVEDATKVLERMGPRIDIDKGWVDVSYCTK